MATKTKPRRKTQTASTPSVTPETDAARALIEKAIDTFNAGDLKAYFGLFTENLESFTGVHTPLRSEGLSAWKSFLEAMQEVGSARYEQRQPTLRAFNDDLVIGNHYFVFSGTAPDGTTEVRTGRASLVCVEQGKSWRIANQHDSKIFQLSGGSGPRESRPAARSTARPGAVDVRRTPSLSPAGPGRRGSAGPWA